MRLVSLALVMGMFTLVGCSPNNKELIIRDDPGRLVTNGNSEIKVSRIGNTELYYVGTVSTQSCVVVTERTSWWYPNSVAISVAPPEACGFPAKEPIVVQNIQLPPQTRPVSRENVRSSAASSASSVCSTASP